MRWLFIMISSFAKCVQEKWSCCSFAGVGGSVQNLLCAEDWHMRLCSFTVSVFCSVLSDTTPGQIYKVWKGKSWERLVWEFVVAIWYVHCHVLQLCFIRVQRSLVEASSNTALNVVQIRIKACQLSENRTGIFEMEPWLSLLPKKFSSSKAVHLTIERSDWQCSSGKLHTPRRIRWSGYELVNSQFRISAWNWDWCFVHINCCFVPTTRSGKSSRSQRQWKWSWYSPPLLSIWDVKNTSWWARRKFCLQLEVKAFYLTRRSCSDSLGARGTPLPLVLVSAATR